MKSDPIFKDANPDPDSLEFDSSQNPLLAIETPHREVACMWDSRGPMGELIYTERGARRSVRRILFVAGRIYFATDVGNREVTKPQAEEVGGGIRYLLHRSDLETAREFKPDHIEIETPNGTIKHYLSP